MCVLLSILFCRHSLVSRLLFFFCFCFCFFLGEGFGLCARGFLITDMGYLGRFGKGCLFTFFYFIADDRGHFPVTGKGEHCFFLLMNEQFSGFPSCILFLLPLFSAQEKADLIFFNVAWSLPSSSYIPVLYTTGHHAQAMSNECAYMRLIDEKRNY